MSDDIVTRLREDGQCTDEGCCGLCFSYPRKCQLCEAADEIERLRAELAHAQSEIARLERLAANG